MSKNKVLKNKMSQMNFEQIVHSDEFKQLPFIKQKNFILKEGLNTVQKLIDSQKNFILKEGLNTVQKLIDSQKTIGTMIIHLGIEQVDDEIYIEERIMLERNSEHNYNYITRLQIAAQELFHQE
ncbi:putative ORFan [Cotonvirus japonicus]|uniref:ORFan n=1 Tax=Cotonvirus japonicus TaxID=2811091 RepID=A0ABM7NRF9_9VIRU|nr:putative ORFan [Cotonvirus japonicus]BCS82676.1 putative ORFan [Cotonvirus japonicus]